MNPSLNPKILKKLETKLKEIASRGIVDKNGAIKKFSLVAYSDLRPITKLNMGIPWHRKLIGLYLGEIAYAQKKNGKWVLLTAVVVQKMSKLPGKSFFTLKASLDKKTTKEKRVVFQRELSKVYSKFGSIK